MNLTYKSQSVSLARFLNENTPPESVFAMGDRAGSLGYQLERPLIQLEGIVNSLEYLGYLESGQVHEFLKRKGVDYVVYSGGVLSGGDPVPINVPDLGLQCEAIREPKFGTGPRVRIVVCKDDMIFDAELKELDMGGRDTVWKYRAERNIKKKEVTPQ